MKTLKKVAAGIMIIAIANVSFAQDKTDNTSSRAISFGVKGGINFANVRGDDFDGPNARTSFHVGALVEFPLADIFSLQVEALYSGQGFQSDFDSGIVGGDGKLEYQLDYINVPVLAKVYATKGLSFEVGPQFSFKVNEQIDDAAVSGGTTYDEAEDFDFGVAGGLTFQTEMGLFATGRYTYGLTDIIKDTDAKNSVFQLGIGYKF